MIRTIKARYRKGKIEPLEAVDLEEGSEILVSILSSAEPVFPTEDETTPTFGVFKDDSAWELFEKELRDRRAPETVP